MKEIRVDVNQLRADRREEVIAWLVGLGVEPNDVRPHVLIRTGESGYELHLSRLLRDEAGKLIPDWAFNSVASEPLVIDLGPEASWPKWLNDEPKPAALVPTSIIWDDNPRLIDYIRAEIRCEGWGRPR